MTLFLRSSLALLALTGAAACAPADDQSQGQAPIALDGYDPSSPGIVPMSCSGPGEFVDCNGQCQVAQLGGPEDDAENYQECTYPGGATCYVAVTGGCPSTPAGVGTQQPPNDGVRLSD